MADLVPDLRPARSRPGAAVGVRCSRISRPRTGRLLVSSILSALVVLAALTAGDRPAAAAAQHAGAAVGGLRVTKVLVVVEENHSLAQMRTQMPYLDGLAGRYGYATGYVALTYPSLPNYLAIAGGSTFGVHDDAAPSSHPVHGQSVFGQALAHGRTARVYEEAQPVPCDPSPAGPYQVKHNPWPYFVDERSVCSDGDVSTTRFPGDARADALPNVGLLVPDMCHDAHDCPLGTADAWLRQQLPAVLGSADFRSGRLVVVVTADSDDHSAGNRVLTVVLHRSLDGRHVVVPAHLDHLSLARLYAQVSHGTPLRSASHAPDLASAFGLAVA